MKLYICTFALLAIVASAYSASVIDDINQTLNRRLAEALEKRAESLLEIHRKTVKQFHVDGHASLVSAIEHELVLVESLIQDLKTTLADKNKSIELHHVHLVEEELVRHEFRLLEEVRVVELVIAGQKKKEEEAKKPTDPKTPEEPMKPEEPKQATPAQLVEKANALVKKGTDALVTASLLEIRAIQFEIHEIEALVKAIQAKPSAADLKQDKLQLERHERSLQILIDRANSGKKN